jgi:hypothetical protein
VKHHIFRRAAAGFLSTVLAACGDAPEPKMSFESGAPETILKDAPTTPIALQDVVDVYVLGGSGTELQRANMTSKIQDAVVVWRFKVYDISEDGYGRYRIISELMDGSNADAFGKFMVLAYLTPRNDQDIQAFLRLQAGSYIAVRGRVEGIALRTTLVLNPAELMNQ